MLHPTPGLRARSRLVPLVVVACVILVAQAPATAGKEATTIQHPENVFPDAESGKARVFLLRPRDWSMPTSPIFFQDLYKVTVVIDQTPVGILPAKTYLATSVDPGVHLVWTYRERTGTRVDFEADRTYVLVLDTVYQPSGTLSLAWILEDPLLLEDLVLDRHLTYVTLSAAGTAKLDSLTKVAPRYAKLSAKATGPVLALEPPPEISLPQTFEATWYRGLETPPLPFKAWKATGTLTITASSVEFASDKLSFVIPLSSIDDVGCRRMEGDTYNEWAVVLYRDDEGRRKTVGFKCGGSSEWGHDARPIHAAIEAALEVAAIG